MLKKYRGFKSRVLRGGGHLPFIKDDFQDEIWFLELAANKVGNQKAGDKYLFEMEIQEPFYRV